MRMNWRPKNPYPEKRGYMAQREAFEVGVDAMLVITLALLRALGYSRVADDLRIYTGIPDEEPE